MQMQRERWNVNENGNHGQLFWDYDGLVDSQEIDHNVIREDQSPFMSPSMALSASSPSVPSFSFFPGATYIEHSVSKLETMAGIAIKYGVDVSDIKKMNGLVTDSQMFALKSIQIPLPGRHPPSPCLSNDSNSTGPSSSNQSPTRNMSCDLFESFQSLRKPSQYKVSPAMNSLQGYYGLESTEKRTAAEACEMSVYSMGGSLTMENGSLARHYSNTHPSLSHQRKSRSLIGLFENNDSSDIYTLGEAREIEAETWNDKPFRRRLKSEADFTTIAPEKFLEDNNNGGGFSAITGEGLALRQKASSKGALACDLANINSQPVVSSNISPGLWESLIDGLSRIRKSSSTSSLQDQEIGNCSSIWSTSRWSDFHALSTAAITKPIFDGLPKPITGRRSKAALD